MRFMIIIYYYSQYSMERGQGHSISCIEDDFTEFHRSYGAYSGHYTYNIHTCIL